VAASPTSWRRPSAARAIALAAALIVAALWRAAPVHAQATAPLPADKPLARITAYGDQVETGTGFLVASGHIVTAYHVVSGARRIDVTLYGQDYRDVEVVAVRPGADLALLKAPPVPLAGAYRTVDGLPGLRSTVFVHGAALGFDNQELKGHLTQANFLLSQAWADRAGRALFAVRDLKLLPLDITAEPGLSGGPVLDERGNVFGVFSGSLQVPGGRGYAWAVPIEYARPNGMQAINRRASAIAQWPAFVYLRSDLSLLRALNVNSDAARLAKRCRDQLDAYAVAWDTELQAAYRSLQDLALLKGPIESARRAAEQQGPASQAGKLKLFWTTMQPSADAFITAHSTFADRSAGVAAACAARGLTNQLLPPDLPATRENVLFGARLTERLATIAFQKAPPDVDSILTPAFDLMARWERASDAEKFPIMLKILSLVEESLGMVTSKAQADFIQQTIQAGRTFAEIMEACELRDWDRAYRTYSYQDPSGIRLSLPNGWASFDRDLRQAMLRPGQTLPDSLKLVKLGTLVSREGQLRPKATAELSWRASQSPQSTSLSSAGAYWTIVDGHWSALQQTYRMTFQNARRSETPMGKDLVLALTGEGQGRNGAFRVYLGYRFSANGVAALTCTVVAPDLDYGSCTELQASLQVPVGAAR